MDKINEDTYLAFLIATFYKSSQDVTFLSNATSGQVCTYFIRPIKIPQRCTLKFIESFQLQHLPCKRKLFK